MRVLEVERQPPDEIPAMLVLRHLRSVAAEKRIAVGRQAGIRIGRHVACVSPKRKVAGQPIFYAAANAVGKIHTCRVATAVELVGEAQAPSEVGPPLVLIAEKHVKDAKLILIHGRIVSLPIRCTRSLLHAVGSEIPVPQELKLGVRCDRIADERAKTCRAVNAQVVYRYGG